MIIRKDSFNLRREILRLQTRHFEASHILIGNVVVSILCAASRLRSVNKSTLNMNLHTAPNSLIDNVMKKSLLESMTVTLKLTNRF